MWYAPAGKLTRSLPLIGPGGSKRRAPAFRSAALGTTGPWLVAAAIGEGEDVGVTAGLFYVAAVAAVALGLTTTLWIAAFVAVAYLLGKAFSGTMK